MSTEPKPTSEFPAPARRALPLSAYFLLTAVVAAGMAMLALATSSNDPKDMDVMLDFTGGAAVGTVLGFIMGCFNVPRWSHALLGGVTGAAIGVVTAATTVISFGSMDQAFLISGFASLAILATAIVGRWNR